jgi:glycine/D-amino acid oxidase-like deaminating enzyme
MKNKPNAVLIGAGIMSATLALLLKELVPDISIIIFERLHKLPKKVQMPGTMQAQAIRLFANLIIQQKKKMAALTSAKL